MRCGGILMILRILCPLYRSRVRITCERQSYGPDGQGIAGVNIGCQGHYERDNN